MRLRGGLWPAVSDEMVASDRRSRAETRKCNLSPDAGKADPRPLHRYQGTAGGCLLHIDQCHYIYHRVRVNPLTNLLHSFQPLNFFICCVQQGELWKRVKPLHHNSERESSNQPELSGQLIQTYVQLCIFLHLSVNTAAGAQRICGSNNFTTVLFKTTHQVSMEQHSG